MMVMAHWRDVMALPEDDTEAANAIRMNRQRILRLGERRFVFLLAEQVLYSRVPSAPAMLDQLDRIAEVMSLPRVSLGLIPAASGLDGHSQTSFWIFDDSLVQVETLTTGLDITRPEEIELYAAAFERMRRTAVFGRSAKAMISRARSELLQQHATA